MTPSLAQLVRKWHRTYSNKNNWDFRYGTNDKTGEDDFNEGYLSMWKHEALIRPAIQIKGNTAVIGEFKREDWGGRTEWRRSIYSDIELIAADPRFFPKLDRAMQFLVRARERRMEADKKFAQEEMARLKEVLK